MSADELRDKAIDLIRKAECDPGVTICFHERGGATVTVEKRRVGMHASTLEELIKLLEMINRQQREKIEDCIGDCF